MKFSLKLVMMKVYLSLLDFSLWHSDCVCVKQNHILETTAQMSWLFVIVRVTLTLLIDLINYHY